MKITRQFICPFTRTVEPPQSKNYDAQEKGPFFGDSTAWDICVVVKNKNLAGVKT